MMFNLFKVVMVGSGNAVFDLENQSEALFHENYDNLGDLLEKLGVEHASKKIIVIGEQNSAKSSLVRRLIELNLVPVGGGTMTRHPCEIRIHKDSSVPKGVFKVHIHKKPAEWFLRQYGQICAVIPRESDTASFELLTDEVNLSQGCQNIFTEIYKNSLHLRLGKSQFIASFVTITISACHLESFTIVDIPGYVANVPETHPYPDDDIATEAIIANVLKDPKYCNAIVIGVVDSSKEANAENLIKLVKTLTRSDPTLKARMIGVASKADIGPMAVQTTKTYLQNGTLRCDLGFFAVVNPNPNTTVQSLLQVYGTDNLNIQQTGTKIESDNTQWNFRQADEAEEAFWQSKGMQHSCGVLLVKNRLKEVFFDKMETSLSTVDNKVREALQNATDSFRTFPMLISNIRTALAHSITETAVFTAIVKAIGDITSKSFDHLHRQRLALKSNPVFSSTEIDPIAKVIDWIRAENKRDASRYEFNGHVKLFIVLNGNSYPADMFFEREIIDTVHELVLRELAVKLQVVMGGIQRIFKDWESSIGQLPSETKSLALLDGILKQYNLKIEGAKESANTKAREFADSIKLKDTIIEQQKGLYERWSQLNQADRLVKLCNKNLTDNVF